MFISELELYEVLREKMEEKEARTLISYIESKVEHKFEQAQNIFSTKEDLLRLELKIAEQNAELQKELADQKGSLQKEISEIHQKIADSNASNIKCMFAFVFGSTIAIIGTILTVMQMGGCWAK